MNKTEITRITEKERYNIDDLRAVFAYLRSENGCPWDRVQTHETIRKDLIEETYEVIEAIDNGDSTLMREELGDLLLQVVFHAGIEEEAGRFDLDDVINDLTYKLISRHTHVFGDTEADDPDKAIDAWEAAKKIEKKDRKTVIDSMNAVPPALPALMRGQKVIKKATKDGFDAAELAKNGADSLRTLADMIEGKCSVDNTAPISESLMTVCAYAQLNGADSEELLTKHITKFIESYK